MAAYRTGISPEGYIDIGVGSCEGAAGLPEKDQVRHAADAREITEKMTNGRAKALPFV